MSSMRTNKAWPNKTMTKMCEIHNVPMQERWRRDDPNHVGESFFSHKTDDGYCSGKPKKPANNFTPVEYSEAIGKVLASITVTINKINSEVQEITKRFDAMAEYQKKKDSNYVETKVKEEALKSVPF